MAFIYIKPKRGALSNIYFPFDLIFFLLLSPSLSPLFVFEKGGKLTSTSQTKPFKHVQVTSKNKKSPTSSSDWHQYLYLSLSFLTIAPQSYCLSFKMLRNGRAQKMQLSGNNNRDKHLNFQSRLERRKKKQRNARAQGHCHCENNKIHHGRFANSSLYFLPQLDASVFRKKKEIV